MTLIEPSKVAQLNNEGSSASLSQLKVVFVLFANQPVAVADLGVNSWLAPSILVGSRVQFDYWIFNETFSLVFCFTNSRVFIVQSNDKSFTAKAVWISSYSGCQHRP